jgi:hypothetical protein
MLHGSSTEKDYRTHECGQGLQLARHLSSTDLQLWTESQSEL